MDTSAMVALGTAAFALIIAAFIAIQIGRRHSGAEDWQTGGRALPLYVIAGTQLATLMGGGVLVGHMGIAYENGWSALTYGLLTAVGLIPLILIARWLRKGQLTSLPDVLSKLYGRNRMMNIITIVCSIVIPFGWLCTNLVAFGNLFAPVVGVDAEILIPIFGFVALAFVLPAGLTSVAWTDFVFGVGMLVMAVITTIFTLNIAGGWQEVSGDLPDSVAGFPQGLWSVGAITIVFWLFAVMPGNLTNQQVYQRVFAAGSTRGAIWGVAIAAVLYVGAMTWASVMGMSIRSMNPNLENPEMAMGWLLTQVPTWLLAIFAAFVVCTIMSTASSAVQSSVVNLTKDIYKDYFNPDVSPRKILRLSRATTVGVVLLGVVMAVFYTQALDWLVMTFAYSVSALLMPIFIGFAFRKTTVLNSSGAVGGMVSGVVGAAIAHASGTDIPYVAFGLITSAVGTFVFSFFGSKRRDSQSESTESANAT